MRELQEEVNSALIIITHDLGVVAELADDILVMYAGRCMERAAAAVVFHAPEHPYTWGLLGSMPRLDRDVRSRLIPIKGTPPSLINAPSGCVFHPRCPYLGRDGIPCRTVVPPLAAAPEPGLRGSQAPSPPPAGTGGHAVACHIPSPERRQIFATEIGPKL
jgi:peptide/nickel transport system ATP-binding protein